MGKNNDQGPFLAILVSRHLCGLSEYNERAREKACASRKDLSTASAQAGAENNGRQVEAAGQRYSRNDFTTLSTPASPRR
jgi:hypothetical protein